MIDLSKQYLNKQEIEECSKNILSLLNTDIAEVRNLYESWLYQFEMPDNPFSLAIFCQSLWKLSGGYGGVKLINIELIEKRPSWSKFYISTNSIKAHIISVQPCTEQAIEYYKYGNF